MRTAWLLLGLVTIGCGSESAEPATPADTGTTIDAAPLDTGAPVEDSATTEDSAVADASDDTSTTDAACASCGALVGKITRKAGTKPTAGGKGHLYVAVFDGNPISDSKNAKLVGRTLIENVDLNPDTASIPYRVDGIPTSPNERQVVAFLDDNKTASATNPAPDKGDLVTIEIPAFSGVKVKIPTATDVKLDLQLNAAIP